MAWRERRACRCAPRSARKKSPTTLVDAIRAQALDGEFDPPPSPQNEEVGGGSRGSLPPADDVLEGAKRLTGTRSGYRTRRSALQGHEAATERDEAPYRDTKRLQAEARRAPDSHDDDASLRS